MFVAEKIKVLVVFLTGQTESFWFVFSFVHCFHITSEEVDFIRYSLRLNDPKMSLLEEVLTVSFGDVFNTY